MNTAQNITLKRLFLNELERFVDTKKDDKNIFKKTFSLDYSIYTTKTEPIEQQKYNYTAFPDIKMIPYNVKGIEGMISLVNEMIQLPEFFGALVLLDSKEDTKKAPYNILSYTFIRKLQENIIKIPKEVKVIIYLHKDKISENIIKQTEEYLLNLELNEISFEPKDDDTENKQKEPTLLLKAPKEWEDTDNDIHLSDLHIEIKKKELRNVSKTQHIDIEMIKNAELVYENEQVKQLLKEGNWCVEMGVIDLGGTIAPAYGIYKHNNNIIEDIVCVTKHPNISSNGSNYCTGVNGKTTIKGVSELSYGNLSSPMNINIWHKDSFSIAKAFQKVYWDLLLSIEV